MKQKLEKLRALALRNGAALVAFGGASSAFAAAPDVTEVVKEIGGAAAPVAAIGAAVLLVMVGIKVFKWVRRAM